MLQPNFIHHLKTDKLFTLEAKPTCQSCLTSALSWVEKLKNSYINDDETAIIYKPEHVFLPIQKITEHNNQNNETTESYFSSASVWFYSNMHWLSATSGGIIFYYGKMILSAMGFLRCPKTGGVCCCSVN